MEDGLKTLIYKSLEIYDNQNNDNKMFINCPNVIIKTLDYTTDERDKNEIDFYVDNIDYSFNYEVLGIFDKNTKVWIWSWNIPYLVKQLTKESRNLLNYAFSKEKDSDFNKENYSKYSKEDIFIRIQFTNSRLYLTDSFQLDILLAICSYVLQNRIKFIFKKNNKFNDEFEVYYLIK